MTQGRKRGEEDGKEEIGKEEGKGERRREGTKQSRSTLLQQKADSSCLTNFSGDLEQVVLSGTQVL